MIAPGQLRGLPVGEMIRRIADSTLLRPQEIADAAFGAFLKSGRPHAAYWRDEAVLSWYTGVYSAGIKRDKQLEESMNWDNYGASILVGTSSNYTDNPCFYESASGAGAITLDPGVPVTTPIGVPVSEVRRSGEVASSPLDWLDTRVDEIRVPVKEFGTL